jgi:hypothetical protein
MIPQCPSTSYGVITAKISVFGGRVFVLRRLKSGKGERDIGEYVRLQPITQAPLVPGEEQPYRATLPCK